MQQVTRPMVLLSVQISLHRGAESIFAAAGVVAGTQFRGPHNPLGHRLRGPGSPPPSGKQITGTTRSKGVGSAYLPVCNDVLLQTSLPTEEGAFGPQRTSVRMFPHDATPGKSCHLNSVHQTTAEPTTQLGKGAGIYHAQHKTHMPLDWPASVHAPQETRVHANALPGGYQQQETAAVVVRDRSLYDKLVARSRISVIW